MNGWAAQRGDRMLTRLLKTCAIVGTGIYGIGCATNPDVIFVDALPGSTDLVRLGDDVTGHVYFRKDGKWIRSQNKVTLPAGWYAGGLNNGDSCPED